MRINLVDIIGALLAGIALEDPVRQVGDIHIRIVISVEDPTFMTND